MTLLFGIGEQLPLFFWPHEHLDEIKACWSSIDGSNCTPTCTHVCDADRKWECGTPDSFGRFPDCQHERYCMRWEKLLAAKLDEVKHGNMMDSILEDGIVNPIVILLGYNNPARGFTDIVRTGNGHHRLASAIEWHKVLPVVFAQHGSCYMQKLWSEREALPSCNDAELGEDDCYCDDPDCEYKAWYRGQEDDDECYDDEPIQVWCEQCDSYRIEEHKCYEELLEEEEAIHQAYVNPYPALLWHAQQPEAALDSHETMVSNNDNERGKP